MSIVKKFLIERYWCCSLQLELKFILWPPTWCIFH